MTYEEFKAIGKDGVYRADLDEWFIAGQEPPVVAALLPVPKHAPETTIAHADEQTLVAGEKPLTKTGAKK